MISSSSDFSAIKMMQLPKGKTIFSFNPTKPSWAEKLFHPKNSLTIFSSVLLFVYAFLPLLIYTFISPVSDFLLLAVITLLAVFSMWVGSKIPLFDNRFQANSTRFVINQNTFIVTTWIVFFLFIILTFATAPSIPIISAFKGATADALSQERGDFLKGRVGVELSLLYISTFLTNTIVPYSIILLYASRSRLRHIFSAIFFIFCVSFMQKTLFLNLILPLFAYMAITNKLRGKFAILSILGSVIIILISIYLSYDGSVFVANDYDVSDYFSAKFLPQTSIDYFLWRAIAVPIFTATDSLIVFAEQFQNQALLGATSSFLSFIFGLERVNFERFVFEYQFGGWNEIANANSVFVIDAYVNFKWLGVLVFGLVVGLVFRCFKKSKDIAFQSLWPLFAFVLFSAPLIGMMLSNGFLFMLIYAFIVKVKQSKVFIH